MQKNSRLRRKKKNRKILFSGVILFLLIFIMAAAGYSSYYLKVPAKLWEELIPIPEGDTISVLIQPGITASQAARAFEFAGALDKGSPVELTKWFVKFGIDKKIRAGHYNVVPSDPWNLARQLRNARPALLKAQILPGLDIFALIDSLSSQDKKLSRENFSLALLNNKNYPPKLLELLRQMPEDEYTRVAFLLPETYMLVDCTADELVSTAAAAWWKLWGEFVEEHQLTAKELQDASIIAAMVEREVLHDDECAIVAGVINNRIRADMMLQIDATVVYAWRLKGKKLTRVLNKDLEINSPYNTYKNYGLPPRPICVPNIAAWAAALNPDVNDFYYYVAGKSGYHYFAKNYNDHLKNIKQARAEK